MQWQGHQAAIQINSPLGLARPARPPLLLTARRTPSWPQPQPQQKRGTSTPFLLRIIIPPLIPTAPLPAVQSRQSSPTARSLRLTSTSSQPTALSNSPPRRLLQNLEAAAASSTVPASLKGVAPEAHQPTSLPSKTDSPSSKISKNRPSPKNHHRNSIAPPSIISTLTQAHYSTSPGRPALAQPSAVGPA